MANNIINRDGNLVEVDFSKKRNKDAKESLITGIATTAAIPALIASGATPFLNNSSKGKSEAEKSVEYRLEENPAHQDKSPRDFINEFRAKNPLGCSYTELVAPIESNPSKSR